MQRLVPGFLADNPTKPVLTPETRGTLNAKMLFHSMPMTDTWEDAGVVSLLVYLRGNKHLRVPPEWRPFLPDRI